MRERKKNRMRERLAAHAVALFAARGFDNTTVDDIVAWADVSRRTFFRNFPTKDAVLFRHHEERWDLLKGIPDRALG